LGNALPRDEKNGVINNPAFTILADEIRFRRIAEKLKNNCYQQDAP